MVADDQWVEDGPSPVVYLGGRPVGEHHPPLVIAELSANHNGSLGTALEVVEIAAKAGADAIKLQTYTPESMTIESDSAPFVVGPGSPWTGRSLYDLYSEAQTPWEWHEVLFERARELEMMCLSTPFDASAVDFLEQFNPPAHKIASFELLDLGLIEYAASTGRPLILSTGMATEDEIDEAVDAARSAGDGGLILLRTNSAYPADPREMDLLSIPEMSRRWSVPVGLSDHSRGSLTAIVASALGATVFEKHVTTSRAAGGPDAAFSAEPAEFSQYVDDVAMATTVRGEVRFGPSVAERSSLAFRRSLFVVESMVAGEEFSSRNVRAIRPAGGLPPSRLKDVLGRSAAGAIDRGTPLTDDLII